MNGRERLNKALNHIQTDRPPIDIGSTAVTGAHVSIVHQLRLACGLSTEGNNAVKVTEPYQMLGEVENDLREAVGIDCVNLGMTRTLLGWKNEGWKPWVTFDGTPCLVAKAFNTVPEANGKLLQWPDGDRSVPASAIMPPGSCYNDTIIRQDPIDDEKLNVEDNTEEFQPITDEDLEHLRRTADTLWRETEYGIVGSFGGTAFGDIAIVPAPFLKHPKGIRDITTWYMSTMTRRDYVMEIFERQCEMGIKNLETIFQAVGNKVAAIFVTGTDFGMQHGLFISPDVYRELYQPFHKRVNGWIHQHTTWKTFIHSCGSVIDLLPDFIDSGFDILNPVQCSAARMDPQTLKDKFGDKLVFWGGCVCTQKTLPYGTPEQVREEAKERIRIFGKGGGFVFNPSHNIQAKVPIANVLEMLRAANPALKLAATV